MEFLILFILIILNGLFAMSEMSIVSAKRVRLQQYADEGKAGAATALALSTDSGTFLSTVQVGITVIGIMNGAFGEATVGKRIEDFFLGYKLLAEHAHLLSTTLFVVVLTFVSILLGELIPKKIALRYPERIAIMVAKPMCYIALIAAPFVHLLNYSSNMAMRVFGKNPIEEPPVTEEEIKVLMEQGAEAGIFEDSEQELVSRVFSMDDRKVKSIMTPRGDIEFLTISDTIDTQKNKILGCRYSRFPVCGDSGLDSIHGIIHAKKLLEVSKLDKPALDKPLYVPVSLNITQLLNAFRSHRQHLAFVVDEYGQVEGLVTMYDVMEALMGTMVSEDIDTDPDFVTRDDGSLLVAGQVSLDKLTQVGDFEIPHELYDEIHTIGGYIMYKLGKIPRVGDKVEDLFYKYEVIDMDKNRVDRILLYKKTDVQINN